MADYKQRLSRAFPVFSQMLKRSPTLFDQTIVAGAVAGDLTVSGIKPGDELVAVLDISSGSDLTGEFTITGDNTINNDGGSSTDTNNVIVTWVKYAD